MPSDDTFSVPVGLVSRALGVSSLVSVFLSSWSQKYTSWLDSHTLYIALPWIFSLVCSPLSEMQRGLESLRGHGPVYEQMHLGKSHLWHRFTLPQGPCFPGRVIKPRLL